ncbi:MAG: sulfatase [bacterium]|nr:sulfatase [bacterium]
MSLRQILLVLSLALIPFACSRDSSGADGALGVRRLVLVPRAAATELPEIETVLDVRDLSAQPEVSVELAELRAPRGTIVLGLTDVGRVDLPVPDEARFPNQVVVHVATPRRLAMEVRLHEGEEELGSVFKSLRKSGGPQRHTFAFPAAALAGERVTHVALLFRDGSRRTSGEPLSIQVLGVKLQHVPRRLRMPPTGPFELAAIGLDARRATCLSSELPLDGALRPQAQDELVFSYGAPDAGRRRGDATVLHVTLSAPNVDARRTSFPLGADETEGWKRASVSLADFVGAETAVSFELEPTLEGEALCLLGEPAAVARTAAARTVVLVTSDTHRADHVGCAPDGVDVRTPFLDRLAQEGAYFEDVLTSANSTNPSHVALFTGTSPRDTGVVSNDVPLADAAPTLAERFRGAGFVTYAATSAVHLGHDWSGLGQGFDRFAAPVDPQRDSRQTIDDLAGWLGDARGAPLFVWLHVFDAHAPYDPPEEYEHLYYAADRDPYDAGAPGADRSLAPYWDRRVADPAYTEAQYRSEVTYLDDRLAELLSKPRFERALVAVTSDHGESLRDGVRPWDHSGLRPATLSVPLILHGPGVAAGTRVERPVRQIDLGRTLLDLAGLGDLAFPGELLLGADLDADLSERPRFALESHGWNASVQLGRWMLLMTLRVHPSDARISSVLHAASLYDLDADPELARDLSAEEPDRTRRLRGMLIEWLGAARDEAWAAQGSVSKEVVAEKLAALGYSVGDGAPRSNVWYDPECACAECASFEE